MRRFFVACLFLTGASTAAAQQVDVSSGSVVQAVAALKPGRYAWAPQLAPSGPALLVVDVKTQRAILYRNGIPIAASTISTGKPGRDTPTGVLTILQKQRLPLLGRSPLEWRNSTVHMKMSPSPVAIGTISGVTPAGSRSSAARSRSATYWRAK
jgi:hypothetical protein